MEANTLELETTGVNHQSGRITEGPTEGGEKIKHPPSLANAGMTPAPNRAIRISTQPSIPPLHKQNKASIYRRLFVFKVVLMHPCSS